MLVALRGQSVKVQCIFGGVSHLTRSVFGNQGSKEVPLTFVRHR